MALRDKFKSKVTFGFFIGFLFLLGAALVGVLLGVVLSRGEEDPVLKVCVVGTKVYYEGDPNTATMEGDNIEECPTSWEERLWSKADFPLKVGVVDSDEKVLLESHEAWSSIKQAVTDANSQFGFSVFKIAAVPSQAQAKVVWGAPYESGSAAGRKGRAPGFVYHFYDRHNDACGATGLCAHLGVRDVSSDRLAYIILMHELGHVLFLEHSDSPSSVMFPRSRDDTDASTILNMVRYTDAYVDAVRERYMP